MPAQNLSLDSIEDFLAQKRMAMVGISREPGSFSAQLFKELSRRGYDVIPVNPKTPDIQGRRCFAHVQDIEPPVEAALLMTSPEGTDAVVSDCAEAGIRRIWMYRAAGRGAVSDQAVQFCREHGIRVVAGECPLMFLPQSGGIHSLHRFLRRITGRYPKHVH
jgi:predicted CoA-binding protein